jgi:hypothetical protein
MAQHYNLPRDILKIIIEYCPCRQWFRVNKEISSLALQLISPLNYGKEVVDDNINKGNTMAVLFLLKDPRVAPSINSNKVMQAACKCRLEEVVLFLLQDPHINKKNVFLDACENGNVTIVDLLLKYNYVNPSINGNVAIYYASARAHNEVVKRLLQDPRVDPNVGMEAAFQYHNRNIIGLIAKSRSQLR